MPRKKKPPTRALTEYVRQTGRQLTPPRKRRRVSRTVKRQQALAKRVEPKLVRVIRRAVERTKAVTPVKAVETALERRNIEEAVDQVPWPEEAKRLRAEYEPLYRGAYEGAATVEATALRYPNLSILAPEPLRFLEAHGAEFVTTLTGITREDLRAKLVDMMNRGLSAREAAKGFVDQIGLTPRLATAVENYRAELIEAETPAAKVAKLVARKIRRLEQYRAMMIARTEAINALVAGQQEAWRQAMEDGYVEAEEFEQEWMTSSDPCPEICEPMNGQRRRLGELFETGDGRMISGPGGDAHPHCLCTLVAVVTPKTQQAARAA